MKFLLAGVGLALSTCAVYVSHRIRSRRAKDKFRVEKDGRERWYARTDKDNFQVISGSRTYRCQPLKWYCSCPGFKFRKYPHKVCVHLIQLNEKLKLRTVLSPPFQVYSTRTKVPFQLIGNYPSARLDFDREPWLWSWKHDGIRVCLKPDGTIVTRGGLHLQFLQEIVHRELASIHPDLLRIPLDCELCYVPDSTHDRVMEYLIHRQTPDVQRGEFVVYVLDICWPLLDEQCPDRLVANEPLGFGDRVRHLQEMFSAAPHGAVVRLNQNHSVPGHWTPSTILAHAEGDPGGKQSGEGVVCRRANSLYSESRSGKESFKVKYPKTVT